MFIFPRFERHCLSHRLVISPPSFARLASGFDPPQALDSTPLNYKDLPLPAGTPGKIYLPGEPSGDALTTEDVFRTSDQI
jgi:hypothetical protein